MRREKIKNTQGFLVRNPAIDAALQIQMGIELQRLFAGTVRQPVPARLASLLDRLKLADRRDDAEPGPSRS
jgi:Anti-sigma factor NepR